MNEIEQISSWTGKRPMTVLIFTDWCNSSASNLFNIQLSNIWNNGSIPIITWEMFGCSGSSTPGIINTIINGSYDEYINQFGNRLRNWLSGTDAVYGTADDRRVFLRLGYI